MIANIISSWSRIIAGQAYASADVAIAMRSRAMAQMSKELSQMIKTKLEWIGYVDRASPSRPNADS